MYVYVIPDKRDRNRNFNLKGETTSVAGRRSEHGRGRLRQSRKRRTKWGTSSKLRTEWGTSSRARASTAKPLVYIWLLDWGTTWSTYSTLCIQAGLRHGGLTPTLAPPIPVVSEVLVLANRGRKCGNTLPRGTSNKKKTTCVPYGTDILNTGMDVVPNLPKCSVRVSMSYWTYRSVRYRYWYCTEITEAPGTGMKVCTGTSGTGIDIVPNLPKCAVPVSISYRTCRSVRYWYWCRTEFTQASGTGIDVVPNFPKCPVPVIPAVCLGTYLAELTLLCLLFKIYPLDCHLKNVKKKTESVLEPEKR